LAGIIGREATKPTPTLMLALVDNVRTFLVENPDIDMPNFS
jgi:hypothetical protein